MTAEVTTSEIQLAEGRRSMMQAVRPLVEGGIIKVKVGSRNMINGDDVRGLPENVVWTGEIVPSTKTGYAKARVNARYHRVYVQAKGFFEQMQGVEVFARPGGTR